MSTFKEFLPSERRLTATMCLLSANVHMWAVMKMHAFQYNFFLSACQPTHINHHFFNGGGCGKVTKKAFPKVMAKKSTEHVISKPTTLLDKFLETMCLPPSTFKQNWALESYDGTACNLGATGEFDKLRKTSTSV